MGKLKSLSILILVGLLLLAGCAGKAAGPTVATVIDGDTLLLQGGGKVRLLGINAPEEGQPYFEEATARLRELVEGKQVRLEKDIVKRDQYGRLLRYVFLGGENINVKLVREGLAHVYLIPPNVKYELELRAAEEEARAAGRGIWQPSGIRCLRIINFHWDAKGNDCENLNDEYVVFQNTCSQPVNMTNWTVKDEGRHIYTFPRFVLRSGATITLHSGCGKDTRTDLYWCSSGGKCNAIWNNGGDTLYLRDSQGRLVLRYSYGHQTPAQ